ncbi:MAG: hypothetical protein AB1440_19650 [Pseudomonadota bacterium]
MRRLRQALHSGRIYLTTGRISLVVGFLLSIAASFAAQFYQQPSADRLQAIAASLDETWARLKIIHSAQGLNGLLQSFDGLVYLVPADFSRNPQGADAVTEVTNRAVHGRHEAMRNYFAQIAAAGLIDYDQTMRRYDSLISAETADWSLKTYRATNDLPAELSLQVGSQRWDLEKSVIPQENSFLLLLREVSRRAWLVAILGLAGSAVIFIQALADARDKPATGAPRDPMQKAVDLLEAALDEARQRLGEEQKTTAVQG